MSFDRDVRGLFFYPPASSAPSQYESIIGLDRLSTYICSDYFGESVTCEGGADGVTNFSIHLPSTGYLAGADYYSVSIHIDGPETISPGGCHLPPAPTLNDPCGAVGGDFPVYDGTLTPGGWVRQVIDQSGPPPWHDTYQEIVPDTFNATGTADNNWRAQTYWPDQTDIPAEQVARSHRAYLVNPEPLWPTLDAYGNTFGNCLFGYGQLPETVDLEMIHHNREQTRLGRLWAFVQAYVFSDPNPGVYHSSIIGYS